MALDNYPDIVILRMTRESPNGCGADINEDTKATKYVLENDRRWTKVTWSYWLKEDPRIYTDNQQMRLLDKPDGKVIEESANINFSTMWFIKADGDWALVSGGYNMQRYQGWIRWRKGRELLVGCNLNNGKIPIATIDDGK